MAGIKGIEKVQRALKRFPAELDKVVKSTLLEYARLIFAEAMANLPASAGAIKSTYQIEVKEGGYVVSIYTDNEIAAYIEFGTGGHAARYLSGQDNEVKESAIAFFVSGEGNMPAQPYLFPAYYKYRPLLIAEMNKRVDALTKRFNNG